MILITGDARYSVDLPTISTNGAWGLALLQNCGEASTFVSQETELRVAGRKQNRVHVALAFVQAMAEAAKPDSES
jgi:hypothetical protein